MEEDGQRLSDLKATSGNETDIDNNDGNTNGDYDEITMTFRTFFFFSFGHYAKMFFASNKLCLMIFRLKKKKIERRFTANLTARISFLCHIMRCKAIIIPIFSLIFGGSLCFNTAVVRRNYSLFIHERFTDIQSKQTLFGAK